MIKGKRYGLLIRIRWGFQFRQADGVVCKRCTIAEGWLARGVTNRLRHIIPAVNVFASGYRVIWRIFRSVTHWHVPYANLSIQICRSKQALNHYLYHFASGLPHFAKGHIIQMRKFVCTSGCLQSVVVTAQMNGQWNIVRILVKACIMSGKRFCSSLMPKPGNHRPVYPGILLHCNFFIVSRMFRLCQPSASWPWRKAVTWKVCIVLKQLRLNGLQLKPSTQHFSTVIENDAPLLILEVFCSAATHHGWAFLSSNGRRQNLSALQFFWCP